MFTSFSQTESVNKHLSRQKHSLKSLSTGPTINEHTTITITSTLRLYITNTIT